MEQNYRINLDSYVAKYMDEHGCSLEEACADLEIEASNVFSQNTSEEFF